MTNIYFYYKIDISCDGRHSALQQANSGEKLIAHIFAMIVIVIAIVVGVIVAVSSSLVTGIIVAAVGIGIGMIFALLNFIRIVRNPEKMVPKNW